MSSLLGHDASVVPKLVYCQFVQVELATGGGGEDVCWDRLDPLSRGIGQVCGIQLTLPGGELLAADFDFACHFQVPPFCFDTQKINGKPYNVN